MRPNTEEVCWDEVEQKCSSVVGIDIVCVWLALEKEINQVRSQAEIVIFPTHTSAQNCLVSSHQTFHWIWSFKIRTFFVFAKLNLFEIKSKFTCWLMPKWREKLVQALICIDNLIDDVHYQMRGIKICNNITYHDEPWF